MQPNPCWILCTPRTGSSYLCELLNNTILFPAYQHPDLKNNLGPIQNGLAFNEWLRLFTNKDQFLSMPPPYCKAIYHQYIEVMGSIPITERYGPGFYFNYYKIEKYNYVIKNYDTAFLSSIFPNINFIVLKRKNLVAHAVSLYFSRTTKQYHIYDAQSLEKYLNIEVPFNKSLLLNCWRDAVMYGKLWDKFTDNYGNVINISYEEITKDTVNTLNTISKFLNLPINPEDTMKKSETTNKRIYKMTHPDAKRFEILLKKELMKVP